MVKFNVSLLLAAVAVAPVLAGYSTGTPTYTSASTSASTSGSASAATESGPYQQTASSTGSSGSVSASASTSTSGSGTTESTPATSTTGSNANCEYDASIPDECDGTDGWYPVSVVGKEGYYCTKGPVCSGETGKCPGVHGDLTFGSTCVYLSEGTYGCVENTECANGSGSVESTKYETEAPVPNGCEVAPDTPAPYTPGVTEETPPLQLRPQHQRLPV
ncbi:unnamed protein product [Phytophthora fragariaefolia]|uniref:Unnamed protein product n=1 Tax=Phytophthora fragariaefolia TaxID=1490495 RepID=A0A9W6YM11_9STRA|nr:unnamed protein product [Phytophthora fragariaefolia]